MNYKDVYIKTMDIRKRDKEPIRHHVNKLQNSNDRLLAVSLTIAFSTIISSYGYNTKYGGFVCLGNQPNDKTLITPKQFIRLLKQGDKVTKFKIKQPKP